jgi:hypothetical protein
MQISSFTPYFGPSPAQTTSGTGASNAASSTDATAGMTSSTASAAGGLTPKADNVVQQFMDYAKMNPPEQQKAVEQKIEQLIKQQLQKNAGQTGQVVDVSA